MGRDYNYPADNQPYKWGNHEIEQEHKQWNKTKVSTTMFLIYEK